MNIDYNKIKKISTQSFMKNYEYSGYTSPLDNTHHFSDERAKNGGEHYQLLTYISNMFDNITILDIGTNWGDSAIALSQNSKNNVISYDIMHIWDFPFRENFNNLEFRLMDIKDEDPEFIKSAKVIFLDIAHDGFQEQNFTDLLKKIDYKGYVFCDDIHLPWSRQMSVWWNSIDVEKYDLTDIGHTWGTGLINYYQDKSINITK